jgi:hypothetical protein
VKRVNEYERKVMEIKKILDSMDSEEKLRYELEPRVGADINEIGKAILESVKKFGSVNKVAEELGVSADSLNYFIQHLSLNEPAKPVVNTKDWKENFQRVRRKK